MPNQYTGRIPLADRFFGFVGRKQPNGCILWAGSFDKDGYGVISSGGKHDRQLRAHRVSYELCVGPIPDGLWVLHRCDNPPCINPVHLFAGTHQDNEDDKLSKKRNLVGERHHASKLTSEKVQEIRLKARNGVSQNQLSLEYKVARHSIKSILEGTTWKHVPETITSDA